MQTLRDIAPWLALSAGVVALVALILAAVLWARLRSVRRAQVVIMGAHEQRDIVAHSEQLASQVRNLRQAVERLTDELDAQRRRLEKTLTHRALVRYDAFRDAGGQQSATLVLLDDYRSGFVVSAIAARDFARVYVKILDQGVADRELSPEERRAVAEAVPTPLPPQPSFAVAGAAASAEPAGPRDTSTPGPVRGTAPMSASEAEAAEGGGASGGAARDDSAAPAAPDAESPAARRRSPLEVDDDFVWESPEHRGAVAPDGGRDADGDAPEPGAAGADADSRPS